MGINTVTTKLLAFSLGASFSGFAGAFTGAYQTAIFAETFNFNVSILVVVIIILGGIGSLRGVVIGAFAVQYVNQTLLAYLGTRIFNEPLQALGDATDLPILSPILSDFNLATYNYLIFGIVLVVMMIKRPEGLFPDEGAKAEMHGIGVAAEVTAGSADLLAAAEETELALVDAAAIEEATAIPDSLPDVLPDVLIDRDDTEPPR
jgi:branched-chain amino acid transport system permease protein